MISDDTNPHLLRNNDSIQRASSGGTSNPQPFETFGEFGDGACGEPLCHQRLVIDFTPNESDTDFLQRKVSSFWQFINNHPEIQYLKESGRHTPKSPPTPEFQHEHVVHLPENSVDMLQDIDKKGLITRVFEAKLPQTYCPLRSHASEDHDNIPQKEIGKNVKRTLTRKPCLVKKLPSLKTKIMCKKLEEWDKKNPKSMEPPGHPPALHHCIVQGQVFKS